MCGPARLLQAVSAGATAAGWPKDRIHTESFGPARDTGDRAIVVYLERSDLTVQVPAGTSMLDAILEAGGWVPYECRRGTCASCMTRLVAGVPDHRDACLSEELRVDHICPCVSRARSDSLVLDL